MYLRDRAQRRPKKFCISIFFCFVLEFGRDFADSILRPNANLLFWEESPENWSIRHNKPLKIRSNKTKAHLATELRKQEEILTEKTFPIPKEVRQKAPTAPVLNFTSNFPVPSPMKVSGYRVTKWEFFRQ